MPRDAATTTTLAGRRPAQTMTVAGRAITRSRPCVRASVYCLRLLTFQAGVVVVVVRPRITNVAARVRARP